DSNAIQEISNETRATDHRTRGNGGAGISKRELEKPESEKCNASRLVSCRNTTQEEPVIADESITVAEHECEADCIKKQPTKTGINYAFHQHVYGFSGSAETGLKHRETNLHGKHQEGCKQYPKCIERIDDVISLEFHVRCKSRPPNDLGHEQNSTNHDADS